jgi:hypothetical protein
VSRKFILSFNYLKESRISSISSNWVYEGKYKLKIPYLFGAAAWGDKFYGQESDFSVQAYKIHVSKRD